MCYYYKGEIKMSFKLYKFCQLPSITILSAVYAAYSFISCISEIPWWGCLLISIVATFIWFTPSILCVLYPFGFGIYMILAIIYAFIHSHTNAYILILIFALHLFRFISSTIFVIKNPGLSATYDELIRYGYKL